MSDDLGHAGKHLRRGEVGEHLLHDQVRHNRFALGDEFRDVFLPAQVVFNDLIDSGVLVGNRVTVAAISDVGGRQLKLSQ